MFKPFKEKLQHHVATMLQHQQTLFVTDTDMALSDLSVEDLTKLIDEL